MEFIVSMMNQLLELTWVDTCEISCFIMIVYMILSWLNRDVQSNLVAYVCVVYSAIFIAWGLEFFVLMSVLMWGIPIAVAVIIILHPRYIQRQYLSLRTSHDNGQCMHDWCDEVMKQTLIMMNYAHPTTWYIEYTYALDTFLHTEGRLHATMTTQFMDLIMAAAKPAMSIDLWVRANGPILGIQPHLHIDEGQYLMATDCSLLAPWQRKALILSHCTDAVIVQGNPLQRTCTIYVQGKIVEQLTLHHAVSLLKHHFEGSATRTKDYSWRNDSTHTSFKVHGHVQSGRSSLDTLHGS